MTRKQNAKAKGYEGHRYETGVHRRLENERNYPWLVGVVWWSLSGICSDYVVNDIWRPRNMRNLRYSRLRTLRNRIRHTANRTY